MNISHPRFHLEIKPFADKGGKQEVHRRLRASWRLCSPKLLPIQKGNANQPHSQLVRRQSALVPLESDGIGSVGSSPVMKSWRRDRLEAKEKIGKELWLNEFQAPVIFKNAGVSMVEPTRAGVSVLSELSPKSESPHGIELRQRSTLRLNMAAEGNGFCVSVIRLSAHLIKGRRCNQSQSKLDLDWISCGEHLRLEVRLWRWHSELTEISLRL